MFETITLGRSVTALLAGSLAMLVVACGSDSQQQTATAVSATAERREQAIAMFTAEALAAGPTATSLPRVTPTAPSPIEPGEPSTPSPATQEPSDQSSEDREALEALLVVRARAMAAADFDTWYATCASSVRDSARDGDALGKQLRSMRLELSEDSNIEFVLEQAFFTGGTSATVVWGWRAGPDYYPSVGGGPYVKEDGKWYSIGWGCAA